METKKGKQLEDLINSLLDQIEEAYQAYIPHPDGGDSRIFQRLSRRMEDILGRFQMEGAVQDEVESMIYHHG